MKLKTVAMSFLAGMFLISSVYAEQGVGQGGSSRQGVDQRQGGQPGDQGAGGMPGGQQGTVPGTDQQGGSRPDGIQGRPGSDLGGTGQKGGAMQGGVQDPATVQQIQQKLNDQGFKAGPVDGKFGPKTQEALRKFQEKQGFQPTGQIDEQTMAALGVQVADQGGTPPGMGSGQQGERGAGQPSPNGGIPGDDQQGSGQGGGSRPDAGTSSPDAGAQGTKPQGPDAGGLQQ